MSEGQRHADGGQGHLSGGRSPMSEDKIFVFITTFDVCSLWMVLINLRNFFYFFFFFF